MRFDILPLGLNRKNLTQKGVKMRKNCTQCGGSGVPEERGGFYFCLYCGVRLGVAPRRVISDLGDKGLAAMNVGLESEAEDHFQLAVSGLGIMVFSVVLLSLALLGIEKISPMWYFVTALVSVLLWVVAKSWFFWGIGGMAGYHFLTALLGLTSLSVWGEMIVIVLSFGVTVLFLVLALYARVIVADVERVATGSELLG